MNSNKATSIDVTVKSNLITTFFHILQNGFMIKAHVGCSIRDFLCEQCSLSHEYIINKISTIFLNGKPVDNMDSAIIRDGSSLALSGAMPGLVGAVMRSGSCYASFRSSITHMESCDECWREWGTLNLKLFNIIMSELGPDFLKRGIFIKLIDLKDFLSKQADGLQQGCREILLNQEPVKLSQLQDVQFSSQSDLVFLSVKSETKHGN